MLDQFACSLPKTNTTTPAFQMCMSRKMKFFLKLDEKISETFWPMFKYCKLVTTHKNIVTSLRYLVKGMNKELVSYLLIFFLFIEVCPHLHKLIVCFKKSLSTSPSSYS